MRPPLQLHRLRLVAALSPRRLRTRERGAYPERCGGQRASDAPRSVGRLGRLSDGARGFGAPFFSSLYSLRRPGNVAGQGAEPLREMPPSVALCSLAVELGCGVITNPPPRPFIWRVPSWSLLPQIILEISGS